MADISTLVDPTLSLATREHLSANHEVAAAQTVEICPDAPAGYCWVSSSLGAMFVQGGPNSSSGKIQEQASGLVHWAFTGTGTNFAGVPGGIQTTVAMDVVHTADNPFTLLGAFILMPLEVAVPWRLALTASFVQAPFDVAPAGQLVRQAHLGLHPSGTSGAATTPGLWVYTPGPGTATVAYQIKRAGTVIAGPMAYFVTGNSRSGTPQMFIPPLKPNETLELRRTSSDPVTIGGLVNYVPDNDP